MSDITIESLIITATDYNPDNPAHGNRWVATWDPTTPGYRIDTAPNHRFPDIGTVLEAITILVAANTQKDEDITATTTRIDTQTEEALTNLTLDTRLTPPGTMNP